MAETFEAIRRGPGDFEQRVCIKRILPAYESDQEFVAAFLREATTGAQLRHANIVQVLDFGVADGSHYLALELVDGMDLRGLMQQAGTLPAELVTLLAIDLGSALHYAHAGENARPTVVHRDISPSNVLVSLAGEVKLVDFGIAKALGGTHLTATGVIKGKVPYLPPEYIERAEFDPRGDLFSLGVTLFEALAGTRPFDGDSDFDTIRRIVAGQRRSLRDFRSDVPDELAACVERLLAVDPAQRFGSAAAFLEALPMISVPAARRKFAELVRAPTRAKVEAGHAETQPLAAVGPKAVEPRREVPTRTSVRPPTEPLVGHGTGPSRRARRLLLVSAACLGVTLLTAALIRQPFSSESATALPPPLPMRPVESAPKGDDGPQPSAPVPTASTTAPASPTAPTPSTTEPPPATQDAPSAATRPHTAELRVVAVPFGDVWIDGRAMGHAPVTARLSPGSHEVAVGDGKADQRRTLRLVAGEVQNVIFRVETE